MINKLIVLFLSVFLATSPVFAKSVSYKKISKGQVADFDGVLISYKSWAKLGADRKLLISQNKQNMSKLKETLEEKHKYSLAICRENLKATQSLCEKRVGIYRNRQKWCQNTPIVYTFIGYMLGALTILGGAVAIKGVDNAFGKQ